jgi:hypothetical protein
VTLLRRVTVLVGVASIGTLGLGAAFVLAGGTQGHTGITICHAPPGHEGREFVVNTPDAESIINGTAHGANHPFDIIPPFVVIDNGVRMEYPGRNMNTVFPSGFLGSQILASGCAIPTNGNPVITQTVTTTTTETELVTTILPGTTLTLPGTTVVHTETIKIQKPAHTVTVPGEQTVITVPVAQTTTVTLPAYTVTLPAQTVTSEGQTVVLPPVTVTVPSDPHTVTGATTVLTTTVTGPTKTVLGNQNGTATQVVTVTTPAKTVTLAGKEIRFVYKHPEELTRLVEIIRQCLRFLG